MMDCGVVGFAAPEGLPSVAQGETLGMARAGENQSPSPGGATVPNAEPRRDWSDGRPSGAEEDGAILPAPGLHPGLLTVAPPGLQEATTLIPIMSLPLRLSMST